MSTKSPTLTFEPFEEAFDELSSKKNESTSFIEKKSNMFLDDSFLTSEEKKQVDAFSEKIDLTNSNMVLQFGAGAQKKISDFSESALNNVKSKDLGEVGDMLTSVVTQLKSFDIDQEERGLKRFFKSSSNKLEMMKTKFAKAETNVNNICSILEGHQIKLLKDIAMLDQLSDLNKTYYKELSMYILAGKKKLEKVRNEDLPQLIEKSNETGYADHAQAVSDLSSLLNRFEKKLHDLELTRVITIQMAPQIRLVQNNDTLMAEKIQSTIVNTIPLWKSQMVIALGLTHAEQAAQAQREVTDMTNELLKRNAEKLKMATINTVKESERGIVDLETLKFTNASLISTLDEVMKIQSEGRQKRHEAEIELNRLENELKQKLLSMQN
jgi:uncharacterized protein YaaN involved in tellurite resistance